eukprot:TRINITY_DN53186_c0_g1_i3.p1 TRINITY_DN53186_c0_g1~~TRINITY_DN53186_c0_g1_i3.p1  ORF type:complete len:144 (-),score=21.47 TRINITY_DN53186_c0_g1_i3:60-491(-)
MCIRDRIEPKGIAVPRSHSRVQREEGCSTQRSALPQIEQSQRMSGLSQAQLRVFGPMASKVLEQWPRLLASLQRADTQGSKAVPAGRFFDILEDFSIYPDETTIFAMVKTFAADSARPGSEAFIDYRKFLKLFTDKQMQEWVE